jgi:hypothetical protein
MPQVSTVRMYRTRLTFRMPIQSISSIPAK